MQCWQNATRICEAKFGSFIEAKGMHFEPLQCTVHRQRYVEERQRESNRPTGSRNGTRTALATKQTGSDCRHLKSRES